MGGEAAPVKSTDVETGLSEGDLVSNKLQNTVLKLRSPGELVPTITRIRMLVLAETGRKRKRATPGRGRRSGSDDPPGDEGPDEATAFIAEAVGSLAELARRHRLDVLGHLLSMAKLEAEERLRLRSKRKLS
jgi:hypothetical protein